MFAGEKAQAEQCSTSSPPSSAPTGRSTSPSTSPTARACSSSAPARSPGSASPPRPTATSTAPRATTPSPAVRRAGCWPASSQRPAAGGPDVSWVSTQHNLLAWFFLSSVDDKVETGVKPSELDKVTNGIADGIERELIVPVDATHSAFVQGVKDPIRPLDVQTLGLLFLEASGRGKSGKHDRRQGPRLPQLGLRDQRPLDRQVLRPGQLQPDLLGDRPVHGLPALRRRGPTSCGPRAPRRCASRSRRWARTPRCSRSR